jgi:orotidine-5'-phosphate decarboxylase
VNAADGFRGRNGALPIVALDYPSADQALALVRRLGDSCRFYKIGSELFTTAGPGVVRAVLDSGADVFLDLKFHVIPNTVVGAVASAARLGARLVTVHASGGGAMLAAAASAAERVGGRCGVLAVTVLTSLDAAGVAEGWGRADAVHVEAEVLRLAGLAAEAGLHGVVCSGAEAGAVRLRFGDRLALLVPGIRLAGGTAHDQRRIVTPATAQAAGARYLILGRAVTAAPDPVEAMARVLAELQAPPRAPGA